MIKKVTKKQGFTLSLKDTFFEKPQGGQIDPTLVVLGLTHHHNYEKKRVRRECSKQIILR